MSRLWDTAVDYDPGHKAASPIAISWAEVQAVEVGEHSPTRVLFRGKREIEVTTPFGEARALFAAYLHDYASKP